MTAPRIIDLTGDEESLCASYTQSNGIRIGIVNDDLGQNVASFDLKPDDAERIGLALIRWATMRRIGHYP